MKLTKEKVTRLGLDLDPLATLVLQPLQTFLCEAIPLRSPAGTKKNVLSTNNLQTNITFPDRDRLPRPNLILLILKLLVEFLTQQMRSLAYNQATILRPVRKQVNQTLQTPEPRLQRVLILMWPGLVRLDILAAGETNANRIKGNNQILRAVNLLKRLDDLGLLAHAPGE